jgi:chromosome segregation ATPase
MSDNQQDPETGLEALRAEVAALRAELADAQIESLRAEVTMLRVELSKARLNDEASSGTIVALRAMLHEARAASARPVGLDGRRLTPRPGNA